MVIKNQKDFLSGLLFTVVGMGSGIVAIGYSIGTASEMGPGYFPFLASIFLAIIGAALVVTSLRGTERPEERIGQWAIKPMFFIILADVLFGVMLGGLPSIGLPPMGFMAAIVVLTIVACRAGPEFSIKEALVMAVIMAASSYFLFVRTLNLSFQVWPEFITG